MHFLALCFIISPFEPRRHQYSADTTAKSPRFNLTASYQMNTTNGGTGTSTARAQAYTCFVSATSEDITLIYSHILEAYLNPNPDLRLNITLNQVFTS